MNDREAGVASLRGVEWAPVSSRDRSMLNKFLQFAALSAALSLPMTASAQVRVSDPWVRGTVAAQTATGAFMSLTAEADLRLIAAASPAAGVVEIHEMAMDCRAQRAANDFDRTTLLVVRPPPLSVVDSKEDKTSRRVEDEPLRADTPLVVVVVVVDWW